MSGERLREPLERAHIQWLEEVTAVLSTAQHPAAGTWARWNALRYLQTAVPRRLEQERRMVQCVAGQLTEEQRTVLWALGELLEALRAQLDHLVGLCHRAEEFASVTQKILTALRHWCREVEEHLGSLRPTALPAELRQGLLDQASESAAALV